MVLDYRDLVVVYLKGLAMGAADAVPGVSGGTIALITGIYDRMIMALTGLSFSGFLELLFSFKNDFWEFYDVFERMDLPFLLVLGSGIFTAVILVLRAMSYLIQNFPVLTYGFFFGLIAVSGVILFRQVDVSTLGRKFSAVSGFSLAFLTAGFAATSLGHSSVVVFFSGVLAITAMVLPGISGSLILVILGQYEFLSNSLTNFTDSLLVFYSERDLSTVLDSGSDVGIFMAGGVFGLFSVAHVVRKALDTYPQATYVFLVSLVIGALRAPFEEVRQLSVEESIVLTQLLPEFFAAAVFGGFLVFLIDYKAGIVDF